MKIQLLGTGAISAKAMPSSYLIDERLLIDCGNGIVKHILNTNNDLYKIDKLLITHLHGDHILDIPFLILLRSFKKMDNVLTIYGPSGLKRLIKKIAALAYDDIKDEWDDIEKRAQVEYKTIKEKDTYYRISPYKVKVVEVNHGDTKPAYGFNINNKIAFSGDASYSKEIDELLKDIKYAILDTSFLEGGKSHMGLNDLIKLSEKYPEISFIPTHMNDDVREKAKDLNNKNIQVYSDLDILEI